MVLFFVDAGSIEIFFPLPGSALHEDFIAVDIFEVIILKGILITGDFLNIFLIALSISDGDPDSASKGEKRNNDDVDALCEHVAFHALCLMVVVGKTGPCNRYHCG